VLPGHVSEMVACTLHYLAQCWYAQLIRYNILTNCDGAYHENLRGLVPSADGRHHQTDLFGAIHGIRILRYPLIHNATVILRCKC